jgi:hypothetical protein
MSSGMEGRLTTVRSDCNLGLSICMENLQSGKGMDFLKEVLG